MKKKKNENVFQGGGIKIIDRRFGQPVYPSSPRTNRIDLLPENFLVSESVQPISRRDFLSVLANVTSVMVRASYSTEPSAAYRYFNLPQPSHNAPKPNMFSIDL